MNLAISNWEPGLSLFEKILQSRHLTMPQPIPYNSIRPLAVGEKVRILPEFQDAGDEHFECLVIEAPADSPRVLIRTLIPDMAIQPTETIEASMLERIVEFGSYADLPPETVISQHLDELPTELRLFLLEKFPDPFMASGRFTPEEADLCACLHPGIALSRAAGRISDERIRLLADTHSFIVLLHASNRLETEHLRQMATIHPGECIIILERHPESGLRHSLRAIGKDDMNPNVEAALRAVSAPAG